MVVEDNREIRHYLSQSLSENYQVYEASNGKEALAILSENEVNLILTDVMMPEMDGIQLCNAVKSHLQTSLYTKMKALTGESVKEFIRRIRLNTAAEMILRNEHSIAEISFLVGFATPSYFTTSFKKYFGCQPTEYIKKQTEGETEEEEREEN